MLIFFYIEIGADWFHVKDFPNFDFDFPSPPTHTNIVFPEGVFERLAALSARIPSLFAKDIARRLQNTIGGKVVGIS